MWQPSAHHRFGSFGTRACARGKSATGGSGKFLRWLRGRNAHFCRRSKGFGFSGPVSKARFPGGPWKTQGTSSSTPSDAARDWLGDSSKIGSSKGVLLSTRKIWRLENSRGWDSVAGAQQQKLAKAIFNPNDTTITTYEDGERCNGDTTNSATSAFSCSKMPSCSWCAWWFHKIQNRVALALQYCNALLGEGSFFPERNCVFGAHSCCSTATSEKKIGDTACGARRYCASGQSRREHARQSLGGTAFPGRAWERERWHGRPSVPAPAWPADDFGYASKETKRIAT